jgi:hypothetical protein
LDSTEASDYEHEATPPALHSHASAAGRSGNGGVLWWRRRIVCCTTSEHSNRNTGRELHHYCYCDFRRGSAIRVSDNYSYLIRDGKFFDDLAAVKGFPWRTGKYPLTD